MRTLLAAFLLLILGGCGGESSQNRPYLYNSSAAQKIDYQSISKAQQSTKAQELERLHMQQAVELQKLKNIGFCPVHFFAHAIQTIPKIAYSSGDDQYKPQHTREEYAVAFYSL